MEAIRSSETSVDTRSTRRHIPEDGILIIATVSVIKKKSECRIDREDPEAS
jgi:hypothetical protein